MRFRGKGWPREIFFCTPPFHASRLTQSFHYPETALWDSLCFLHNSVYSLFWAYVTVSHKNRHTMRPRINTEEREKTYRSLPCFEYGRNCKKSAHTPVTGVREIWRLLWGSRQDSLTSIPNWRKKWSKRECTPNCFHLRSAEFAPIPTYTVEMLCAIFFANMMRTHGGSLNQKRAIQSGGCLISSFA